MVYESSYESGRKPFLPDTERGHWERPSDFIFLCVGLAFKLDFFVTPMSFFIEGGVFSIVPYMICLALYVVPIMIIHSFMGQFSSSGFISAFRVSPLFKGMGYISLALNFAMLTYYSIFATVPMLFFFNSLKPTLPWSCEAFAIQEAEKKMNMSEEVRFTICNATDIERMIKEEEIRNDTRIIYELPSSLYFRQQFPGLNDEFEIDQLSFSWELFGCSIILWASIAGIFFKYANTPQLGKILRYAIWTTISILVICIIRFMCLPGAINSLSYYILPSVDQVLMGVGNSLVYSMYAFGPGWGSVISLSSFNRFNRDIMRDSWIICLGQMLIFMAFNFSAMLINWHFSEITDNNFLTFVESHWDIYLSAGSAIANMSLANFWSLLYFGMLTLAALVVMTTQLYTFTISLFDEFENLRPLKMQVTFILIGVLACFSLYLCTNEGIFFFSTLSTDSLFTQTALNLLLLLVILWIYGRERFQRDIKFMLDKTFPTAIVNMLRFVSPLCLLFILLFSMVASSLEHMFTSTYMTVMAILFILLPWISVPAYGLFITMRTIGDWPTRIKRSCRPTDWYPVAKEDRQRYEEAMGNENITHTLDDTGDEVL